MLARERFETETPNVIDPGEDTPIIPRLKHHDHFKDEGENNPKKKISVKQQRSLRRSYHNMYMNGNKGKLSKGIRISRRNLQNDCDDDDENGDHHNKSRFKCDYDTERGQARLFAAAMINESERRHSLCKGREIKISTNLQSIKTSDSQGEESVSLSSSSSTTTTTAVAASSTWRKLMKKTTSFRNGSDSNNGNNYEVNNPINDDGTDIFDIEIKKKMFQFDNDELDTIKLVEDTNNAIDTASSSLSPNSIKYLQFIRQNVIRRMGICFTVAIILASVSFAVVATISQQKKSPSSTSPSSIVSTAVEISNDERLESIIRFLTSAKANISSARDLYDVNSPQYKAAKWLMIVDSERLAVPDGVADSRTDFIQRYVLAVFYFALDGSSWINNYHFISDNQHECSWFDIPASTNDDFEEEQQQQQVESSIHSQHYAMGVTCDHNLRVRSIVLPSNNLKGSIPSEIKHLKKLIYLDLSHNSISGSIASREFQNMVQLEYLNLSHNRLDGAIPSWFGSELRHLKTLLLHDNLLTGTVPESIGSLPNLSILTLHHNNVSMGDAGSFICASDSAYFSSSYPKAKLMLELLTTDCGDSSCPCCFENCCDTENCFEGADFWNEVQSSSSNNNYNAFSW